MNARNKAPIPTARSLNTSRLSSTGAVHYILGIPSPHPTSSALGKAEALWTLLITGPIHLS